MAKPSAITKVQDLRSQPWSVADPGGEVGAPIFRGPTSLPNFPKNCMKLKQFGPQGGVHVPRAPLDPPLMVQVHHVRQLMVKCVSSHFSGVTINGVSLEETPVVFARFIRTVCMRRIR